MAALRPADADAASGQVEVFHEEPDDLACSKPEPIHEAEHRDVAELAALEDCAAESLEFLLCQGPR